MFKHGRQRIPMHKWVCMGNARGLRGGDSMKCMAIHRALSVMAGNV